MPGSRGGRGTPCPVAPSRSGFVMRRGVAARRRGGAAAAFGCHRGCAKPAPGWVSSPDGCKGVFRGGEQPACSLGQLRPAVPWCLSHLPDGLMTTLRAPAEPAGRWRPRSAAADRRAAGCAHSRPWQGAGGGRAAGTQPRARQNNPHLSVSNVYLVAALAQCLSAARGHVAPRHVHSTAPPRCSRTHPNALTILLAANDYACMVAGSSNPGPGCAGRGAAGTDQGGAMAITASSGGATGRCCRRLLRIRLHSSCCSSGRCAAPASFASGAPACVAGRMHAGAIPRGACAQCAWSSGGGCSAAACCMSGAAAGWQRRGQRSSYAAHGPGPLVLAGCRPGPGPGPRTGLAWHGSQGWPAAAG